MQADGYAGALGMRAFVFSLVPLLLPIFIYLCFADKFFFALDVHPKMVGENLEKDYIHMCKNTHCWWNWGGIGGQDTGEQEDTRGRRGKVCWYNFAEPPYPLSAFSQWGINKMEHKEKCKKRNKIMQRKWNWAIQMIYAPPVQMKAIFKISTAVPTDVADEVAMARWFQNLNIYMCGLYNTPQFHGAKKIEASFEWRVDNQHDMELREGRLFLITTALAKLSHDKLVQFLFRFYSIMLHN